MKRLVFEEIQILSYREKKAIKIKFNPKKTIIKGSNQVGKSSLIKSIYYTLGATPQIINQNWVKAEPICFLKLKIDDKSMSILRYDKSRFAVVDDAGKITPHSLKSFSKFINTELNFKLIITNRNGEAENPPTSYLFLPFYVDQDKDWNESWNTFTNLSQFSSWKKPLIDYHSGIRGNKYYETKTALDSTRLELSATAIEEKADPNMPPRNNSVQKPQVNVPR